MSELSNIINLLERILPIIPYVAAFYILTLVTIKDRPTDAQGAAWLAIAWAVLAWVIGK